MDLLRWWRFLWALDIEWNRATRADARDFTRWMQIANKPQRLHWRHRNAGYSEKTAPKPRMTRKKIPGTPNAITGKASPGPQYAARTRAHCETVLRTFYDFHLDEGTGPIINPFPLDRSRRSSRANAHHKPDQPFKSERAGRYRPVIPKRAPRRIPDEMFNALFAALRHNRDRALLAFWVSNAARAEELLTSRQRDALPGQQLVGVIRKGTRAYQQLPCSTDAFVWLRLYQEEARRDGVPHGKNLPLWWTLRRPWRPLNYDAARAMFNRTNDLLGANWTLHDLRHTASYRLARDPNMPLTDVQWVLGHAHLTTTQLYLPASQDEVIERVRAHHARRAEQRDRPPAPPAPGYNSDSMKTLFGNSW
jgi:integrase